MFPRETESLKLARDLLLPLAQRRERGEVLGHDGVEVVVRPT